MCLDCMWGPDGVLADVALSADGDFKAALFRTVAAAAARLAVGFIICPWWALFPSLGLADKSRIREKECEKPRPFFGRT